MVSNKIYVIETYALRMVYLDKFGSLSIVNELKSAASEKLDFMVQSFHRVMHKKKKLSFSRYILQEPQNS